MHCLLEDSSRKQRASHLGLEIEGIGSSPPGAGILGSQGGKPSPWATSAPIPAVTRLHVPGTLLARP